MAVKTLPKMNTDNLPRTGSRDVIALLVTVTGFSGWWSAFFCYLRMWCFGLSALHVRIERACGHCHIHILTAPEFEDFEFDWYVGGRRFQIQHVVSSEFSEKYMGVRS